MNARWCRLEPAKIEERRGPFPWRSSIDGLLCPCYESFKSVNPPAASQLSRGCMPYILYIKNNKRLMPICKYYLEIFLLLFDRSWREAVHLERFASMLFEGGFRLKFLKFTSEASGIIAFMINLVNRLSDYLIIQLCFPYCTMPYLTKAAYFAIKRQ